MGVAANACCDDGAFAEEGALVASLLPVLVSYPALRVPGLADREHRVRARELRAGPCSPARRPASSPRISVQRL
jgi:hypothetical protein